MTGIREDDYYWVWLTQLRGCGPVTQHKLLAAYSTPKEIYEQRLEIAANETGCGLTEITRTSLEDASFLDSAKQIIDKCEQNEISIKRGIGELPERFMEFTDLPVMLYVKGQDVPVVLGAGIVGPRRCTKDIKSFAIMVGMDEVMHDNVVVSGMAKGVDSYVQTSAIKEGGVTYAVLAHGLDRCYPIEHKKLMEAIIEHGLVISEYAPGIEPRRFLFPQRNRIIAGLSAQLTVIGMSEKSGTVSTVKAAKKYGVRVFSY